MENPHSFLQCSDHARVDFHTLTRAVSLRITVARSAGEIDAWLDAVRPTALGLDIEWKPMFHRDLPPNRASLLQLAFGDSALLVQLFYVSVTPALRAVLANNTIPKLGVGVTGDVAKMRTDWGVEINGAQELGTGQSLAKVAFAATGVKLSKKKKISKSNWEYPILSTSQVVYAALDAWVAAETFAVGGVGLLEPTKTPDTKPLEPGKSPDTKRWSQVNHLTPNKWSQVNRLTPNKWSLPNHLTPNKWSQPNHLTPNDGASQIT